MTNNQLTREWLQQIISNIKTMRDNGAVIMDDDRENALQAFELALAAMDSEPVAYTDEAELNFVNDMACMWTKGMGINEVPLYRHAQPAAEYPETLPCPVLLEPGMRFGKGVKTRLVLEAIQRRAEHYAELEAMTPEERAEYDAGIEAFKAMLPQPAPVVPEVLEHLRSIVADPRLLPRRKEWVSGQQYSYVLLEEVEAMVDEACRAAMLNGGKS